MSSITSTPVKRKMIDFQTEMKAIGKTKRKEGLAVRLLAVGYKGETDLNTFLVEFEELFFTL